MANIYLISSMVTVAERNICHACGAGPKLLPLSWLRATFSPRLLRLTLQTMLCRCCQPSVVTAFTSWVPTADSPSSSHL